MGLIIQLSSFLLLFLQSIITPYLIGLESYGESVVYILPMLLFSSILEPFYVKSLSHSSYVKYSIIAITSLVIIVLCLCNYFLISDYYVLIITMLLGFFFIGSLLLRTILYRDLLYKRIALIEMVSVATYAVILILLYNLKLEGRYIYISSLLGYSLSSFILYYFIADKKGLYFSFKIDLNFIYDTYEALAWKSYHIYINILLLIFMSFFYTNSFIGSLKIIFSVLSGMKFLIPLTLPMFYNKVKSDYHSAKKYLYYILALSCILSISLFFIGRFLANEVKYLNDFIAVFENIEIFLIYPFVLNSPYVAVFFILRNRAWHFLSLTTISFLFIILSIVYKPNGLFLYLLLSISAYQVLALVYILKTQQLQAKSENKLIKS